MQSLIVCVNTDPDIYHSSLFGVSMLHLSHGGARGGYMLLGLFVLPVYLTILVYTGGQESAARNNNG